MGRIVNNFFAIVVTLAVAVLVACGESPPPAPQPQVVKKKIAAQQTPSTNAVAAPAPASGAKSAPDINAADAQKGKASDVDAEQADPKASALVKASMEIASSYDPKGRFDPFEALFKEEPSAPVVSAKEKRKKRIPQTPLERVAISQLKLSAIMRMSKGNSAIVEDATGKGYVIKKGTYVGLNAGQVTQINKDRVVIEEEIENVMGELIIQNTELKLQKPAGEL